MLKKIEIAVLVILVAVIPVLLCAQDTSAKTGVLNGDKVRVRTGPGTNHKILIELRKDSKVIIHEKKDDWYKIEMPQNVLLWVSKNLVKEIKKDGKLTGEITGNTVNIRTGIDATDIVVGQLNKGSKITIVGSKEGWYKIRPPKGVTAYIYSKYVKVENEPASTDVPAKPENNEAEKNGDLDKYEERLNKLKEQIQALDAERIELERLLSEKNEKENELVEKLRKAEEIYESYKRDKQKIEDRYSKLVEILEKGTKPKPRYAAEGYVDDIGRLFNSPPATHRLFVTGGGEPRYYLISADASINLDNYLRKRVGVEGEIVEKEWDNKKIQVIKVIRIAILED